MIVKTPPKSIPSVEGFGLGHLQPPPDKRDLPMYPLLVEASTPLVTPVMPTRKTWKLRKPLDQGNEPECVGFSAATKLRCEPFADFTPDPRDIYDGAQRNDEWEGEDYEGSSVRGAMKYLKSIGEIGEYRAADTMQDLIDWVKLLSPVLVGTTWLYNMFWPDAKGKITASGGSAGGHAYCIIGVNDLEEEATICNTWGRRWGAVHWLKLWRTGRGYIKYRDLEKLVFDMGGEAWAGTKTGLNRFA